MEPRPDTDEPARPTEAQAQGPQASPPPADSFRRRPMSMHEGIASWCDCCSCEAEPYWVAVAEELGIAPVSDYEDGAVR